MAGKPKHVVPHGDEWAVREEGARRVISVHPTQREAEERAKELAHRDHTEVVIHRPDGRIRDKDSFGRDPYPPEDRKH